MALGLRGSMGVAAPPFTAGPYTWDQQVSFTGGVSGANTKGKVVYVDGTLGSDQNSGSGWSDAMATIQAGVTAAGAFGVVYITPKTMAAGDTDPSSYAENIVIPAAYCCMRIIGIGHRVQGGLPQIKIGGTVHSYMLTIRAPGCFISNIGFNGNSTAGAPLNGAIVLDDNGSTKTAFGTSIVNCHFKNCAGTTVTDCRTGGAIDWSSAGGAWQVYIGYNRFYKNVCDVCLLGTSADVPQDVVIEHNVFSGPTASVDTQLYLAGGSGMNGIAIHDNIFPAIGTLGSAVVKRCVSLTGCTGEMVNNYFGVASTLTFGAAGTGGLVPTTIFMMGNKYEAAVANDNYQGGWIART